MRLGKPGWHSAPERGRPPDLEARVCLADLEPLPMPSTRSCFSCGSQRCCRPSMRSWWLTCCAGLQKQVQLEARGFPRQPAGHAPATGGLCLLPHPGEATETAAARATEALLFGCRQSSGSRTAGPFCHPRAWALQSCPGAGQAWSGRGLTEPGPAAEAPYS